MDVEALFTQIAVDMEERGVRTGEVFGGAALLAGDEPVVCLKQETMGFKLDRDPEALEAALAHPEVGDFAPHGDGEPEPGWVGVPVSDVALWQELAEKAVAAAGH